MCHERHVSPGACIAHSPGVGGGEACRVVSACSPGGRRRGAGHLGRHSPAAAAAMVASNLVETLTGLVASRSHTSQVCGLRELAQLSLAADAVASQLLTPRLLAGPGGGRSARRPHPLSSPSAPDLGSRRRTPNAVNHPFGPSYSMNATGRF